MDETPVVAALQSGVLTLTLNRPQRLNAMSHALIESMLRELARARDDAAVRAVLLTGTGRGFCAGADLAGAGPGMVDADGRAPRRHARCCGRSEPGVPCPLYRVVILWYHVSANPFRIGS